MKKLELNLEKKLLIVESDSIMVVGQYEADVNGRHIELICKASELNEEIASVFVENFLSEMGMSAYRNYSAAEQDLAWGHVANNALESFISAVESKGYYWGKNPVKAHTWEQYAKKWEQSKKAEQKTFNLEKTLIFERR